MNIITISREFGSGGKELGKRLADALNIPCYDDEIVEAVCQRCGYGKDYAERFLERDFRVNYPVRSGSRFANLSNVIHPSTHQAIQFALAQQRIIRELAAKGDCIVVGRCADVILREFHPMNLFVYADLASKLARCRSRAEQDEHLTAKELQQMMKRIDKDRSEYRELLTSLEWGRKESYHLCINTSGKEIADLIPGLKTYIISWFGEETE